MGRLLFNVMFLDGHFIGLIMARVHDGRKARSFSIYFFGKFYKRRGRIMRWASPKWWGIVSLSKNLRTFYRSKFWFSCQILLYFYRWICSDFDLFHFWKQLYFSLRHAWPCPTLFDYKDLRQFSFINYDCLYSLNL